MQSMKENRMNNLERCQQIIECEEDRKVLIFDMDGTLYEFEGPQNTYQNSELEKRVNTNALNFIIQRERCSTNQAFKVLQLGQKDQIGLSNYLSQRYQISRKEYFDSVWNIDPDGYIKNFKSACKTVQQCAINLTKCILVTSAPQIWQQNIMKYLGLEEVFEEIYSGENFDTKEEIFKRLSQRYRPENITSIGDQVTSDIEPAITYGFNTFLVNNPDQIIQFLEQNNYATTK